jgi:protein TonB
VPAHADFLDRPEAMTRQFWVSLTLHAVFLGSLVASEVIHPHLNMGDPHGGGMGAFMVNPVASIPLPNQSSRPNPVANDTKSQVPTPPVEKSKPKPIPKVRVPEADAVPLPTKKAVPKHHREVEPQPQPQQNRFREQETYKPNQIYSNVGQQASSPMYQLPGGGGVGLGDSSPFGEQFGAYANIIRDNIARSWKPVRNGGALSVTVMFTILRNGSVTNVKITGSSGNQTLDFSAQRAVMDASLPALPLNFPRNQADVQMKFELGN